MTAHTSLTEMTLEELWALFPIVLVPHNPCWKEWATDEIRHLTQVLSSYSPIINHIGSTAIPTIMAKPIIDMIVEIPQQSPMADVRAILENNGYICMAAGNRQMSFNKGYTPSGYAERVFHLHLRHYGNHDELYFRDYLTSHPDIAHEYERLKLSLLPQFKHDRDAYTRAKSSFITHITAIAKESGY